MFGRGDHHSIDIFAIKQLLVLRKIDVDFAGGALLGIVEMSLVAVGSAG